MEENKETMTMTTAEMLELEIRDTIEQIKAADFSEELRKPREDKLKILVSQYKDIKKLEDEACAKAKELNLEQQKLDADTAIKIRELELKEADQKKNHELEEQKLKEQKKSNTTNAVIGGVTAATGIAGIWATLHCFKRSLMFEETGSYTNKSGQTVGGLFNLFRRRG